jgi:hypothetical protein
VAWHDSLGIQITGDGSNDGVPCNTAGQELLNGKCTKLTVPLAPETYYCRSDALNVAPIPA